MSALSLADIKRERDNLLSRQASNEKWWNEFNASPAVPLAQQPLGTTIDEWTARMRNMYEGTKTDIARALEKLREQEARIRSSLAAEPLTAAPPSRHTGAEPPSQILLTTLNNEEYGMAEDLERIKKDLIKFYIYYFTIQKYSEEVATQLHITKNNLDKN